MSDYMKMVAEKQSEKKIIDSLEDIREYIRSKLKVVKIGESGCFKYACSGDYHLKSDPRWKPFKHFTEYCEMHNLGWYQTVKDVIEEHLQTRLVCECQLANNTEVLRRAHLQKCFGIDFGEPGKRTCGLVDNNED